MVDVEGVIEEIIYRNEDNGYTILTVATDAEEITVVGTLFRTTIGERIVVKGNYNSHPIYGLQLKAEEFQCFMPQEQAGMEKYLSSGAIKGIGPSLAKKIVEEFGNETFKIIEESPDKLSVIKGISMKKAQEIARIFFEQKKMRQVIIFLQDFGVSLTYAVKIFNEYKDKSIEIVKGNPYKLAEDIHGIGFKMADSMAYRVGIDRDSPERIMAGIKYTLNQASQEGHLFLEQGQVIEQSMELLETTKEHIENAMFELVIRQQLKSLTIEDKQVVYLMNYFMMEKYIAQKLLELADFKIAEDKNISKELEHIEDTQGICLDELQKKAIIDAMNNGVLVVTGGPGTGKTTTINAIIEAYEDRGKEVLLAAPTGRAAKRMTETTGKEAKTIHRLLEISFSKDEYNQKFERNEEYPLEADVVIIDEVSMMDVTLTYYLLKAIAIGTRLVLVGDKDQLPSVGPGNILKDIIKSEHIKTVVLDKIFRQAMESDIVINAHKIHKGESFSLRKNDKDFFFIGRQNAQRIIEEIIGLIKTRLPEFAGLSGSDSIQLLTPMRKGLLGVENLNTELQKAINPPDKKEEKRNTARLYFARETRLCR